MQLGCAATHRESQPQRLMGFTGLIEPSLNLARAGSSIQGSAENVCMKNVEHRYNSLEKLGRCSLLIPDRRPLATAGH